MSLTLTGYKNCLKDSLIRDTPKINEDCGYYMPDKC